MKTRKHYNRTILSDPTRRHRLFLPSSLQHAHDGSSLQFSRIPRCIGVSPRYLGGKEGSSRRGEVVKKTGEDDTSKPWL